MTNQLNFLHLKQVNTVEGITTLQIPPGTQPGDILVLAKKGVPKLNKSSIRGDHIFTIKVTIPNRIRYTFFSFCFYFHCYWVAVADLPQIHLPVLSQLKCIVTDFKYSKVLVYALWQNVSSSSGRTSMRN